MIVLRVKIGEGRHPGDITRTWTVVRGGKSKPPKAYNRNGLTPKDARHND